MTAVRRALDVTVALLGMIVLAPVFGLIALAIKIDDGGPVLFAQQRIGRGGSPFRMLKFRSMVVNAEGRGGRLTAATDSRITPIGKRLRNTKLDELPQLLNVLKGDMTFVGPRPEVEEYVRRYSLEQRAVLALTPGITDVASLKYRHEEKLLAEAADPERYYTEVILPDKINLNLAYARQASVWRDAGVVLQTLLRLRS